MEPCRFTLKPKLRVAVGPLQEAGVAMTSSATICLSAPCGALRIRIVLEGMEVTLPWKIIFILQSPEMSRERVWVQQFSPLIGKHIIAYLDTVFLSLAHFQITIAT